MSTFWSRTKRRVVAALAAGATGAAAAYCVYTWYTATSDHPTPPESEQPASSTTAAGGASSSRQLDEGPSTSAAASSSHSQPSVLIDPSGGSGAATMDAEAHLQHHFDSIQQIAETTTLPSLLPSLGRAIANADSIEASLERLRLAKGGSLPLTPEEKRKIWDDLAISSLARLVAAIWALPLLSLQVRVQLNVLGRHLYLESVLQEGSAHSSSRGVNVASRLALSPPSQEAFLSFSEHLTKIGHVKLLEAAREAAESALAGVPLDHEINAEALDHLLSRALALFSQDAVSSSHRSWAEYLLPSPMELREALRLRRPDDRALLPGAHALLVDVDAVGAMVEEVGCILGSERFKEVALLCARKVGGIAAAGLAERMGSGSMPLARLVPVMVAEAKEVLLSRGASAIAVAAVPEAAAFSATVYSCGPPL